MPSPVTALQQLQPAGLAGLSSSRMLEELPPVTPLAQPDEPSYGRTRGGTVAATSSARRGGGGGGASLLDALLSSALKEVPTIQGSAAMCLPPQPFPASFASPSPTAESAAPPPLRKRRLLPPPEVPAHVLASLRTGGGSSPGALAHCSPPTGSFHGSSSDLDDTAASATCSEASPMHPALAQAISWMQDITRKA